nr:MAG TPA: Nsp2-type cysteine proteinase [Caudoviricetes sp.]
MRDPPPDASCGLHYRRGWHSDLHGALHPSHPRCQRCDR